MPNNTGHSPERRQRRAERLRRDHLERARAAAWLAGQGLGLAVKASGRAATVAPPPSTSAASVPGPNLARLPYVPGLDGLRALAVIAVLIYHCRPAWLPGGFLGVEVFLVLSGYLITSLLLTEWRKRGSASLVAFWRRRARRLYPALLVMVTGVLAYTAAYMPDELASLRADALASVGGFANWYLLFSNKPYFQAVGRPSLLRHMWSLGVELQFYLLWPPILLLLLRLRRTSIPRAVAILGAAASVGLMAWMYWPDLDPSRIYYGSDTRAAGMLLGAALALTLVPGQARRGSPTALDVAGVVSLGVLVGLCVALSEFNPLLYQGGIALVAIATAATIAVTVHPRSRLVSRVLAWGPLRWLGVRSYGIYLWHWPVFMVTRPGLDVPLDGPALFALRLAVTLLLTEASYRLIELPVGNGVPARAWSTLRQSRGRHRLSLGLQWAGAAVVVMPLMLLLGVSVSVAQPPAPPPYLTRQAVRALVQLAPPENNGEVAGATATPAPPAWATPTMQVVDHGLQVNWATAEPPQTATPAAVAMDLATPAPPGTGPATATAIPTAAPDKPPADLEAYLREAAADATPIPGRITAIGDSVMLGAMDELQAALAGVGAAQELDLDASLGRQAGDVITALEERRATGQLGATVILHVGNNGSVSDKQFDEIMEELKLVARVIFVNVRVPRTWEETNNTCLADGISRYENAVLVDWHGASFENVDLFWDDGTHLRPEGADLYAALIAEAVTAP